MEDFIIAFIVSFVVFSLEFMGFEISSRQMLFVIVVVCGNIAVELIKDYIKKNGGVKWWISSK